jgi:hypothetical protein
MKNKVTAYTPNPENDSIQKNRKERSFYKQITLVDLNTGKEVLIARFYGNGQTRYCCVWSNQGGNHLQTRGSGKAGGYGYCKESAALGAAIQNAGFKLQHDIGGVGESAMRGAFEAIARFSGLRSKFAILTAHA